MTTDDSQNESALLPVVIPCGEIPEEAKSMASCYARGDQNERMAILLRVFEQQPLREVAEKTGLSKNKVDRLASGFREVYGACLERRSA